MNNFIEQIIGQQKKWFSVKVKKGHIPFIAFKVLYKYFEN